MFFSLEPDTLGATLPRVFRGRIDDPMRDDWLIHDSGIMDA